jgi:hypothetical protein
MLLLDVAAGCCCWMLLLDVAAERGQLVEVI